MEVHAWYARSRRADPLRTRATTPASLPRQPRCRWSRMFEPSGNRLRPTARRIRVGAVAGVEGQGLGKQPEERAALLWFGGHCQGCAEGLGGGLRWMVGQALAVSGQEFVQVGHGAS